MVPRVSLCSIRLLKLWNDISHQIRVRCKPHSINDTQPFSFSLLRIASTSNLIRMSNFQLRLLVINWYGINCCICDMCHLQRIVDHQRNSWSMLLCPIHLKFCLDLSNLLLHLLHKQEKHERATSQLHSDCGTSDWMSLPYGWKPQPQHYLPHDLCYLLPQSWLTCIRNFLSPVQPPFQCKDSLMMWMEEERIPQ